MEIISLGVLSEVTEPGGVTTTYTYGDANQLLQTETGSTVTPFTHDADGNLTSDGTNTFTWNAPGRLTGADTPEDSHSFTYNAEGHRVTTAKDGALERSTVWDSLHPLPRALAEYDGTGEPTASYTYNPYGQIQTQSHATEGYQQYHLDWLGSVADTTDANGAPQHRYSYDAFGTATHTQAGSSAPANPFTFTGAYTATSTDSAGLYLNARDYRPDLGRFTSTDPHPGDQGVPYTQPYAYVENMPTSRIDPSGLCSDPAEWLWTRIRGQDCDNTPGPNTGKALDAAGEGIDAVKDAYNTPHPVVRGLQWLIGVGPDTVTYGPGTQGVRDLQNDISMDVVRAQIVCAIQEGEKDGTVGYNLVAEEGVMRFIEDAHAVVSLGLAANRSATTIFTGSFDVRWEVRHSDPASDFATVDFKVINVTGFNSLTHPPVPYVREMYESFIGEPVNQLLNNIGGPLSDVTNIYTWSERLRVGRRPRRFVPGGDNG